VEEVILVGALKKGINYTNWGRYWKGIQKIQYTN